MAELDFSKLNYVLKLKGCVVGSGLTVRLNGLGMTTVAQERNVEIKIPRVYEGEVYLLLTHYTHKSVEYRVMLEDFENYEKCMQVVQQPIK